MLRGYHPRWALVLGGLFVVIGVLYGLLQGSGDWMDHAGAVMLIVLGGAMAFAFTIILAGTRDL